MLTVDCEECMLKPQCHPLKITSDKGRLSVMLEKLMGRLVLVSISIAIILILAAAFESGNVVCLAESYSDNTSGSPPVKPPDVKAVPAPEPQPVPPPDQPYIPPPEQTVPLSGSGGCGGCGGGCGGGCPPQTAMSYNAPAPPPPSSPPPLPPLVIDFRTLQTIAVEWGSGESGGGGGGGGGR